jgi:hypothetical protein
MMDAASPMMDHVEDFSIDLPGDRESWRRPVGSGFQISNLQGIHRLQMGERGSSGAQVIDWDAVNDLIQCEFDGLADQVGREIPGIRSKAGRSAAKGFSLFSYRVFPPLEDEDFDPIIVGVTCVQDASEVRITGDISGEETGRIYFDRECARTTEVDQSSVAHAAGEIARRLATEHQLVIRELREC